MRDHEWEFKQQEALAEALRDEYTGGDPELYDSWTMASECVRDRWRRVAYRALQLIF